MTATCPRRSRNCSSAAKFEVCSARPNTPLAGFVAAIALLASDTTRPVESTVWPAPDRVCPGPPVAESVVLPIAFPSCPATTFGPALRNAAQLMPDWYWFESVTSMILASSITCRSIESFVARK